MCRASGERPTVPILIAITEMKAYSGWRFVMRKARINSRFRRQESQLVVLAGVISRAISGMSKN